MSFVPLPTPATNTVWSSAVLRAYARLSSIYQTGAAYVSSDALEAHRLRQYGMAIVGDAYPLLTLMEESAVQEGVPDSWINRAVDQFSELFQLIEERWNEAKGEASSGVTIPEVIFSEESRLGPGRPRKEIDAHFLRNAYSNGQNIPKAVLARILQIDRKTLRHRLDELVIDTAYSTISDTDLDALVKQYVTENPNGGRSYVAGWLRSKHGLRVQRNRVIASMIRVDKLGHGLKQSRLQKKPRQKYSVPRPNALWHIDGHHKLIHWGIVIHGVADGYSRTVTGLRASTNNSADTVLHMFIQAIKEHGVPSRVRGDRGGENRDVAILMIMLRGLHRASFMWGPSVFNTRIERMWVELGERFVRQWRAFFTRLENQHLLDRKSTEHRWLLQYLFLDMINEDCNKFCREWNAKPISGAQGRSPNELVLLGQLQHGYYDDECRDLSEDEVYDFYGFERPEGSGDSVEDDNDEDIDDEFDPEEIIDSNIRHDAVPVPPSSCPLAAEALLLFQHAFTVLKDSGDVPMGYGATENELGKDGFDEHEDIVIGIRRQAYPIRLPMEIWAPRMRLWVQGLYVLDRILAMQT